VPTDRSPETTAVVSEVRIAAQPETIFGFFTDPSLMVRWMGEEATLNPRPEGAHRIRMAAGHVARGEYVEVEPPNRVVLTWGWEHQDTLVPPGSSTVEVELIAEGDETLVRLTHRDLPADSRGPHGAGWAHYLARLEVAAVGGDPGPDRGPAGTD
jgi:uncharacterized protein YndB with AHSA1/START domain